MKVIFIALWVVTLSAVAEDYSRYVTRGRSHDVQPPYETSIQYYTGGEHMAVYHPSTMIFRNRWLVTRSYTVDAYGRPIAGGALRSAGEAERAYVITSPEEAERVRAHEAEKQRRHREYLVEQQGAYKTIVGRTVDNQTLRDGDGSGGSRSFNNNLIETNRTLSRLLDKYNNEEMSKP